MKQDEELDSFADSTKGERAPDVTAMPPEAVRRRLGRRAFKILGAAAGALLLGIGIYLIATHNQETTDDAQVDADVVAIAARTGGQVLRVFVHENDPVKQGDVILHIDDVDHAARLKQALADQATAEAQLSAADAQERVISASAKGGLSSARAQVSSSSRSVAGADAQINAAQAALERAEAEGRKAQLDLDRAKQLYAAKAVSKQWMDNAQIAYDEAQAAFSQARANLANTSEQRQAAVSRVAEAQGKLAQSQPIDAQIAVAHAQTELARAKVQAAQAAVVLAQNQLAYTNVKAPVAGVLSQLSVHEGQLITMGQPIGELVPHTTYVVANFKETQIDNMRPGNSAKVKIDAFPGREIAGRVESLSGGTGARFSLLPPDNATGNFVKVVQRVPVRIAWVSTPQDLPLKAGLSADVTVYTHR